MVANEHEEEEVGKNENNTTTTTSNEQKNDEEDVVASSNKDEENNSSNNNSSEITLTTTQDDIADFLSNLTVEENDTTTTPTQETKQQQSSNEEPTTTASHSPSSSRSSSSNSSNATRSGDVRRSYTTQASCRVAENTSSSNSNSSSSRSRSRSRSNSQTRTPTPTTTTSEEETKQQEDGQQQQQSNKYLSQSISCYVCKMHFVILHHFYDRMCPTCAEFNMKKRSQTYDLTGRVALVTGGRIKIGYEVVLILLRAGCEVITTTRFPRDAAMRFAKESDYNKWKGRLHIYALDLRVLPALECFVHHLNTTLTRLDILINNAAQTIRRPPAFYRHLMPLERAPLSQLTDKTGVLDIIQEFIPSSQLPTLTTLNNPPTTTTTTPPDASSSSSSPSTATDTTTTTATTSSSLIPSVDAVSTSLTGLGSGVLSTLSVMGSGLSAAELSQVAILPEDLHSDPKHFPQDEYDFNGQQVDLRHSNTWVLPLDQVSSAEAAEVHVINALAPFILNSKLKALMSKSGEPSFIINVSSMEGRFASYKEPVHPHTNMAKAALNMMTCTSAKDYAFSKIYMNSVDTGWVTEENPEPLARRKNGFGPPLDEIDGAARILDPIFSGLIAGRYEFGRFYKDYKHSRWEFSHHDQ